MNILYLTTHLNVGGITSYLLSLTRGLAPRGHTLHIASSGGEVSAKFIEAGAILVLVPIKTKSEVSPQILISARRLTPYIKTQDIDIIHSNTRVTQVLGCYLSRYCHKPHVTTCHGFFKPRIFRRIFPCWGNMVIAISESVKEHLRHDFGVKEENIRLIYNGIDLNQFRMQRSLGVTTEIKKKLGLQSGPIIGIVARLSDVKGHTYLIQAMQEVVAKVPQAQLLIVGEGKMKKELLRLSQRLDLENKVIFLPSVDDTAEVLSLMDLFVLPSLKEGLGLGLMEAMASGLAVIGSDVGGIKNLIQHSSNGFLVRPADAKELSAAILELLKDEAKRRSLGRNAQSFIGQKFPLEKMAQDTERLYRECLNAKL